MRGKHALDDILTTLRSLGGYFTFQDDMGEEYVVVAKKDIGMLAGMDDTAEVQLSLPPAQAEPILAVTTADEVLERINRDIAMFQDQQLEEDIDDLSLTVERIVAESDDDEDSDVVYPPPRRVRFEPLRGDLPPELQE